MIQPLSFGSRLAAVTCLFVLSALDLGPGTGSAGAQPRFGTSAVGVLVDVTVRDSRGDPLSCLAESEFEILEDGVPQQIRSFDRVGMGRCGGEGASVTPRRTGDAVREVLASPPTVTALVFEQLGPEARTAAWHAANAFVTERRPANEFVGVFYVDRAVHTLVPYTANRDEILRALRQAAMRPGCPVGVERVVAGAADASGCSRGEPIETLRGLRAIVGSLRALPGRKNILLFSEGFIVSSDANEFEAFQDIVGDANSATITFQSIDAAGLRVGSPSAGISIAHRSYAGGIDEGTGGAGAKLHANEILSKDPTVPLALVARETGGQFVGNTNDLIGAVRRVGSEMRAYYRLTYVPTRQTADAKFRRIAVRVRADGAVVHTRSGYSAGGKDVARVPPPELAPHLLLDGRHLPKDFEMTVDATADGQNVKVLALVSSSVLHFETGESGGQFEGGVTVLARLQSKSNRVLASTSETFALSGPGNQLAQARARTLRFEKALTAAGAETLEVVAYDVLSGRASAARLKIKSLARK